MDYENMGVLGGLRGMLVGRPWGYTETERRELHDVLLDRSDRHGFPIVADMDFGHTAPQLTLPVGCVGRIDVAAKRVEVTEAAVE
jgi:muramoyltetrapeptide carboxypeptidase LdcA involved in peptidoglycan recycling